MTTNPFSIDVYRTGDVTAHCTRKVYHRRRGEYSPEVPTAMFRGGLAAACIQVIHECNLWTPQGVTAAVLHGESNYLSDLADEGRTPTKAVKENIREIRKSVANVLTKYAMRYGDKFQRCELVGTEVPINLPIRDSMGFDIEILASHIDVLILDHDGIFNKGQGRYIIWDHKWMEKNITIPLATRHLQLYCYILSLFYGEIQLDPDLDIWVSLETWPAAALFHLPSLMPYQKKTTVKDPHSGNETVYERGQDRPEGSIIKWVNAKQEAVPQMEHDIYERVQILRSGLYPKNPDPIGCMTCDCQPWCSRADITDR